MVNQFIETMLSHRTIREFRPAPVDPAVIETLKEVARRTSTSTGMQQASIIRVTSPEKREALAAVGGQEYLSRAPELWVFVADSYRNAEIAEEWSGKPHPVSLDPWLASVCDAVLMAQNVLGALESMGLGGCFLGCIRNDIDQTRKILALPEKTFPVLGLIFGVPNQEPQLKPRMSMEARFFENQYERPAEYTKALDDYNQEMTTYYDLREANRRVDAFFDQVVRGLGNQKPHRVALVEALRRAGYETDAEAFFDAQNDKERQ